ncbi:hypothetical protein PV646_07680 [Streptomyces sp. ID05-26A]|nr:hypothetical protein [Streptomyces sp. ID05-26A]
MGIEMPAEVRWLIPIVVGDSWPEGDETALQRLAEVWKQAATDVDDAMREAENAVKQASSNMDGEAAEAFKKYWEKFVKGEEATLPKMKDVSDKLSTACRNCAMQIEYAKLSIIIALVILAIQIAVMIASAVASFGASTAGIVPAQLATRAGVQIVFRQLVQQLMQQVGRNLIGKLALQVGIEVATSVATDLAVQGIQLAKGTRDTLDTKMTLDAAKSGLVSGVIGAGVGAGMGKVLGDGVGDSIGRSVGRNAAEEAIIGAGSALAEGAMSEEGIQAKDVLFGATSGAVSGSASGMKSGIEGMNADIGVPTAGDMPRADAPRPDGPTPAPRMDGPPPAPPTAPTSTPDPEAPPRRSADATAASYAAPPTEQPHHRADPTPASSAPPPPPQQQGAGQSPGQPAPATAPAAANAPRTSMPSAPPMGGTSPSGGGFSPSSSPSSGGGFSPSSSPSSGSGFSPSSSPTPSGGHTPGSAPPAAGPAHNSAPAASSSPTPSGPTHGSAPPAAGPAHNSTPAANSGPTPTHGSPAPSGGPSPAGGHSPSGGPPPGGAPTAGHHPSNSPSPSAAHHPPAGNGPHAGGPPAGANHPASGPAPGTNGSSPGHTPGTGPTPGGHSPTAPHGSPPPANAPFSPSPQHTAGPASQRPPAADVVHQSATSTSAPFAPQSFGPQPNRGHADVQQAPSHFPAQQHSAPQQHHAPPRHQPVAAPAPHQPRHQAPPPRQAAPQHAAPQQHQPVQRPAADQPRPVAAEAATPHERPARTPMEEFMRRRSEVPLPDNLKHLRHHTEFTKAGLSLLDDAGRGGDRVKSTSVSATTVAPDPHRYTVDVHGSVDSVRVGDTKLTPRDLADIIRGAGDWDGKQPIRLLSCQTGNNPDGFAAHLSKELGVEVVAPVKDAWVDDMGNVFASSTHHDPKRGDNSPGWPPNGDWVTFKPDGTSTKHDRAVPPGATPTWGSDVPEKRPLAWKRGEPSQYHAGPDGVWREVPPRNAPPPHETRGNGPRQWLPNQQPPQQHRQPPPPGAPMHGRPPQGQMPQGQMPQRHPNHGGPQQQHRPSFDQHNRQPGFDPRNAGQQRGFDPRHQQHHQAPGHHNQPQQQPHQHPGQQHQQQQGYRQQPPGPQYSQAPRHGPQQPRMAPPGQQPRPFQGPPGQQPPFRQPPPQAGPNQQGMRPMPPRADNPQVRHDVPARPAPIRDTQPVPPRPAQDSRPRFDTTPVQRTPPPAFTTYSGPPGTETPAPRPQAYDPSNDPELRDAIADYRDKHPEFANLTADEWQAKTRNWALGPNGELLLHDADPAKPAEPRWKTFQKWVNDLFDQKSAGTYEGHGRDTSDQDLTFAPGGELPADMTRTMPRSVLDGMAKPVDMANLREPVVWRDDADFLRKPLFRLDGFEHPIIGGPGIEPKDSTNMNVMAHVGPNTHSAFTSFGMSAEHVVQRESSTFHNAHPPRDVEVGPGVYERVEYVTEAYHPSGIHVDATIRDNAHGGGSHGEGELLFPGGMHSEYIYRVWTRTTRFTPETGEITTQTLNDPQVNPGFKYRAEIEEIEREMAA